ncbi:MAG: hypothetical protein D5R97_01255 [Candidatus Syntrophonatronum acetioxidans]|uniref:Uncharacterized protein n=1 Tax=Candidatus Syntrophonatronum acetioxidans TaxID=1795816 RepID=A0A424YI52_9FIRM|nr:MAG: hypothetical protein D5R97_01255 [Candidatus Syntrophonatronum acetioxidans]
MTINEMIVKELENKWGRLFPDELKRYLLVKYAEEPFPYEFSQQDLYANIKRDINAYDAGKLDVTLKSQLQRLQKEREYLQNLYAEKCYELRELSDYATELEQILTENGLESPKMRERRLEFLKDSAF